MASAAILEYELSEVRLLVERQTGTLLDCPNSALTAHIEEYIESRQLDSAATLLDSLRANDGDPAFMADFLDGLINTSTGFFRHPGALNAFARQVLPQLYSRKSSEAGSIRIWSAGCGTGEEAYSIAMAVCDSGLTGEPANSNGRGTNGYAQENPKEKSGKARNGNSAEAKAQPLINLSNCPVHIVGSDLLPSAIRTAERGLYPASALTGLPPAGIRSCFSKIASARIAGMERMQGNSVSGEQRDESAARGIVSPECVEEGTDHESVVGSPALHLLVKPRVRSLVTFNTMNLVRPVYIGRFDCIFCMDVLPYLSRTQRVGLLERLHLYLEPGGYLFLSQTEKLSAPNLNFRAETYDRYTFYRKPLAASAAYGR